MLLIGRSSACAFSFSRGRQQTGTPRTGNRRSGGRSVRVRRKVCVRAVKAADDLERTYVVDRYTHGPTRQIHAVALLVGLRPAWVLRCGGWASWTRDVWLAVMASGERRRRRPAAFKLTDVRSRKPPGRRFLSAFCLHGSRAPAVLWDREPLPSSYLFVFFLRSQLVI